MKKALLIGAVVSSMALSSVAFAAVDYENATAWTKGTDFNYDIATGVLTVANGKTNAAATTDTTIVVVNGENPTTIDQTNIMYIDQAASADTYGNMGLLLPETIADGAKATVLFNDGTAAIYTATFDLKEAQQGTPVTIYYGDVNGDSQAESKDAAAILVKVAGGAKKVTGGAYDIGAKVDLLVK